MALSKRKLVEFKLLDLKDGGWDYDDAVYELDNGLYVSSDRYDYEYSYRPSIKLYYCNEWYASVDGKKLISVNVYKQ